MSNIIYSTNNGLITQGIVGSNEPITKVKVFIDDPMNMIGFRRSLKHHGSFQDKQYVTYLEIGHFMEMLFEGNVEAFDLLNMEEEHIDFRLYDFDILKKDQQTFISRKLLDNLIKEADALYVMLDDPEKLGVEVKQNKNEFLIQKLAYNNKNAYLCLRYLTLAENLLKTNEYKIEASKLPMLQGVLNGQFSFKSIKDGYKLLKDSIEELEDSVVMVTRPDLDLVNKTLLEIRNVKITTLNVAKNE